MATLYQRLGGQLAIEAVGEILYDHIYADARLSVFFENVERSKMVRKQVDFLSDISGGPKSERDVDLRAVHRPLLEKGLNEEIFNIVAGYVAQILTDMKVAEEDIAETLHAIASFKPEILDQ